MSKLEKIIDQLTYVANNPKESMDNFKAARGKGAIGVLPVYAPEEIIYASGYLPIGIWGAQTTNKKAATYLPAFACSIMQSIMELQLKGTYDDLTAVIIPSPCDTLKCMGQKWKGKCPSVQFVQPQNRNLESANIFLMNEYSNLRSKLEEIIGEKITDQAINEAIDIYNENRSVMREFTEIAADYPHIIDPVKRHSIIKARFFMDKAEHTKLIVELIDELKKEEIKPWDGKRVVLTGIMAEPYELIEIFKDFDLAVVADDLAQESRQFRVDAPDGEDPLYRLAKMWQNMYGCSLATDREKSRIQMLVDMTRQSKADAVIVCMMKFCEPEEFDYPLIYKRFEEEGIRNINIEIDQQSSSFEQVRTRIQSFTEMM